MIIGLLTKAGQAKTITDESQIREEIQLAWNAVQIDGITKGWDNETKSNALQTELKKEDNSATTSFADPNIKITYKGYETTLNTKTGTMPNNPGTNTTDSGSDPATEYGYKNNTGVVEANTLEPGDLINYYYKDSNEQIKKFLCVVMYNDETHGLQAISLFSVRNITLGYGENYGVLYEDSKVVQAFSDKNNDGEDNAPIGYTVSLFEKARWSYNHAIGTLNSYAQEYLVLMAENARCLGAPENSIVTEENESNNMFTANPDYTYFTSYNGIFKSSD